MIKKGMFAKGIIIILYIFLLSVFLLIYKQQLNICLSKDYILMQNVKIDSIYSVSHAGNRNGDSHYINFKDSDKKISLLLEENTLIQKNLVGQLFNDNIRTYNLVKREKIKSFFPQNTVYFTYDDRFICDANGKCNFTEAYKKKQLGYLILGALVFIGITYFTYRVYNSRIIKSLKEEKFQFKFLDSFKD
ncbi:hypothetical protein [Flavobacterium eburneipallidum]|uniref:hypothetical protein n=1 Tax=Flavobacterium eburneipallidum TaxID=3003263 RepID=UPI0024825552|nr:hypothetical protein [Flavobacterium eburneipallidum]